MPYRTPIKQKNGTPHLGQSLRDQKVGRKAATHPPLNSEGGGQAPVVWTRRHSQTYNPSCLTRRKLGGYSAIPVRRGGRKTGIKLRQHSHEFGTLKNFQRRLRGYTYNYQTTGRTGGKRSPFHAGSLVGRQAKYSIKGEQRGDASAIQKTLRRLEIIAAN